MSNTFFQGGENFSREGFASLVTGLQVPLKFLMTKRLRKIKEIFLPISI